MRAEDGMAPDPKELEHSHRKLRIALAHIQRLSFGKTRDRTSVALERVLERAEAVKRGPISGGR